MNVSDVGFRAIMGKISVKWVGFDEGAQVLDGGAVPPPVPPLSTGLGLSDF